MKQLAIIFVLFALSLASAAQTTINVVSDYSAVHDGKEGFGCSMTSSSAILTCTDITFASGDVGKTVNVFGAVPTGGNQSALHTTVSTFTDASHVVLATTATRSVSLAMVQMSGTDTLTALQNAVNAACASSTAINPYTIIFPSGIYSISGPIVVPAACSYVTWDRSTTNPLVISTAIISSTPGATGFGQGGSVLSFASSGGRDNGGPLSGTSISVLSKILTCTACSFVSPGDVGKTIYVQYAGATQKPLITTIASVQSSSQATLSAPAQSAIPLSPQGISGPVVIIGYTPMRNLTFADIDFQNMGYYAFQNHQIAGSSILGLGVIQWGADSESVKLGFSFHDSTIMTMSNNCWATNGVMDSATVARVACNGSIDASFYMAGIWSNSTLSYLTADSTGYPLSENLVIASARHFNAFLVKPAVNNVFDHPTVDCYCQTAMFTFGDFNSFDNVVQNGTFDGNGVVSTGVDSNITHRLTVKDSVFNNISGNVFFFNPSYAAGIDALILTGNSGTGNGTIASFNDSAVTGSGPANVTFSNNTLTSTGNGVTAQHTRGTNYWTLNHLTDSPSAANACLRIFNSGAGAVNDVYPNPGQCTGYTGSNSFDTTVIFTQPPGSPNPPTGLMATVN